MQKKILVIDDEIDMGQLVKDYLEEYGYETLMAIEALEGLKIVEKEKPAVVFLDILMPEISGIECLQRIKKIAPETIVVIVSGMMDEQIAKEAIRHGAYEYITKPFDLEYLKSSILGRIFTD